MFLRFATRTKYGFLLMLCFVYFLFRERALRKTAKAPRRIIVIHTAKLGDMVCATPLFRAIKHAYPESKLLVVGNAINKELLMGNVDVDQYIVWKNSFFELLRVLKEERIDFGCVVSPGFLPLAALYLAGIRLIAAPIIQGGFSPYETRTYRSLRRFVIAVPYRVGHYMPLEYLRLLEPISIVSKDTKKHLFFSEEARRTILAFFEEHNIEPSIDCVVGIAPSVGNKVKQWGGERFARVAEYLEDTYRARVIVTGGPGDREGVERMFASLGKETKAIRTLGMFTIEELKALISMMNLFISVDTGPVYIAEAFDVSTIDIIGPIDDREQPPMGPMHKVVKLESRDKPELHVMNARIYNYEEARRQIEGITVPMVLSAVDEVMSALGRPKVGGRKSPCSPPAAPGWQGDDADV